MSTSPGEGSSSVPPRVLVVRAPEVPTYFNAGHHLPVFMVSAYLRRHCEALRVDALDPSALNMTWKELGDRLWTGDYDVIACMNDYGDVTDLGELVARARVLCPRARFVTFGRLSARIPRFLRRYELDGIVASGDYETGVATFLRWLDDPDAPRPGVAVRAGDRWLEPTGSGTLLPPDEWVLPDVGEIPHEAYDRLYLRAESRFCGLPGKRELVVPVARGCPIGCEFCEVWAREGLRERRLPVARVVAYIRECLAQFPFDYVAMYAPTFTLRRPWVLELCDALEAEGRPIAWKCTTTLRHLDEALLEPMARSGCVRVSVGIESMEDSALAMLPEAKRHQERLASVADCCRRLGVELNCFVVLGLPGTTVAGTTATIERLDALGARVRPMFYAPYHLMTEEMDERQVARLDRNMAPDHLPAEEKRAYHSLFHPAVSHAG